MKTIIAIFFALGMLLASLVTEAQSRSDKMYDAFAEKDGITSFSFSKNIKDAFNIDLGDNGEEKIVSGDLHQVRFMSYNPKKGEISGSEFIKKAVGYLPKTAYKKYQSEGDDENTEIWLKGNKKKFKECHIFINNEGEDQVRIVVSFFGDFTVKDLNGLKKTGKEFSEKGE